MKLLAWFLAGFAAGACFSWLYFRAALRIYEKYIHDRLDKALERAATRPTGSPGGLRERAPGQL